MKRLLPQIRRASTDASFVNVPYRVFDRHAKLLQKQRAATRNDGESSRRVDYLREEIADRLLERFQDIKRDFRNVLDLGAGSGHFSKLLPANDDMKVTLLDMSSDALNRDASDEFEVPVTRIEADEEHLLQYVERNSLDAVVSCLSLHWVNDLPGALIQIKEALKPDGVFIGAMLGGDTLFELRTALQVAEMEREGGISPRVSPMTDTRDISNLLGRAGFTLLTVDIDEVKVMYPSMWELISDLRDMGESNAVVDRRTYLHRDTLLAASSAYQALHGEEGRVPATFQIVFMIGWKPAPNQPKALPRGSGKTKLQDVLGDSST